MHLTFFFLFSFYFLFFFLFSTFYILVHWLENNLIFFIGYHWNSFLFFHEIIVYIYIYIYQRALFFRHPFMITFFQIFFYRYTFLCCLIKYWSLFYFFTWNFMELFFINVIFFKPSTMALARDKKKIIALKKIIKTHC
jgi:hypothetical protein